MIENGTNNEKLIKIKEKQNNEKNLEKIIN